jgi:hypothetical protein
MLFVNTPHSSPKTATNDPDDALDAINWSDCISSIMVPEGYRCRLWR